MIRKLGIPVEIFPSVQRTSSVAGYLADEWVRLLHLSVDIPVIFGGGDNQLSMLGSGLISPNSPALINIGTGAQISKVSSVFQKIMGVEVRPFFDGQFALVSASLGGGGHYQQLRDSFIARGIMLDYAEMDALAKGVPAGSEGLMYCSGPSRSQPQRKRGFFGNMEKITSPGHQARAVMEGVLMDLYEADQLMGQDGEQEWLIGSGKALQQSQVWAQIAADLFGRGLQIPYVETAILGVALAAGWSAKELGDKQIWQQSINYGEIIRPDPLKTNFYKEQFARLWLTKANQFSGSSLTS